MCNLSLREKWREATRSWTQILKWETTGANPERSGPQTESEVLRTLKKWCVLVLRTGNRSIYNRERDRSSRLHMEVDFFPQLNSHVGVVPSHFPSSFKRKRILAAVRLEGVPIPRGPRVIFSGRFSMCTCNLYACFNDVVSRLGYSLHGQGDADELSTRCAISNVLHLISAGLVPCVRPMQDRIVCLWLRDANLTAVSARPFAHL